jgi:hypothetical protein
MSFLNIGLSLGRIKSKKRYNIPMTKPDGINPRLKQTAQVQRCGWPDCHAACCIYGTWIDKAQANLILEQADLILPWMNPDTREPDAWFDGQEEDDQFTRSRRVRHTTVIPNPEHYGGTSCIFLRADHKCALQVAAEEIGKHHWYFKPFYCILHPMELDQQGNLTIDDLHLMTVEPASCLQEADEEILLTELFQEEIKYLFHKKPDE